jgi:hypothetical protein
MTNDKDSAVLADKSDEYAIGHLSALLEVELHENGHTIGEDLAEKLAEIAVKTVRQPTQSDALLEGDAQTILYLLGVRHGREDERAKIAAEASQPTQSDEEAYYLGKRDGYETAVQDIDMLTGGDGEYCYSTIEGERHCPNVDTMKARIARRLRQPTQSDALREALGSVIALLDTQAEPPKSVVSVQDYARWANARIGLGLVMIAPRLRAALQEQSK